ncbi:hypothetical protein Acr_00g0002040 [Actinidia rufa]|uniref:Uncharacterized protein n=1 Tax=Actinidia rufa TaxID=165716 RepID=A0A7J0D6S3_9ERIC|nr:hypothetical protein Acr_00g0002040 [Actinidia rufa]
MSGYSLGIDWRTGPASQDRKSLLLWTKRFPLIEPLPYHCVRFSGQRPHQLSAYPEPADPVAQAKASEPKIKVSDTRVAAVVDPAQAASFSG